MRDDDQPGDCWPGGSLGAASPQKNETRSGNVIDYHCHDVYGCDWIFFVPGISDNFYEAPALTFSLTINLN